MSMIKDYKEKIGLISMRIEPCRYTLLNDEDEPEEDWRDNGGELIIYQESIYFYSQSKWDSSDQIESECISFDEIIQGFVEVEETIA